MTLLQRKKLKSQGASGERKVTLEEFSVFPRLKSLAVRLLLDGSPKSNEVHLSPAFLGNFEGIERSSLALTWWQKCYYPGAQPTCQNSLVKVTVNDFRDKQMLLQLLHLASLCTLCICSASFADVMLHDAHALLFCCQHEYSKEIILTRSGSSFSLTIWCISLCIFWSIPSILKQAFRGVSYLAMCLSTAGPASKLSALQIDGSGCCSIRLNPALASLIDQLKSLDITDLCDTDQVISRISLFRLYPLEHLMSSSENMALLPALQSYRSDFANSNSSLLILLWVSTCTR